MVTMEGTMVGITTVAATGEVAQPAAPVPLLTVLYSLMDHRIM